MHVVITITAMHDRLLYTQPDVKRATIETYHWHQAAVLLNQRLSMPIQPSDRDPLWATAFLLAVVSFCSTEASSPEDSWPLRASSPSDLEWLRFSDGKKAILEIANPLRPESVFYSLADEHKRDYLCFGSANTRTEGTPSYFAELYELDDVSSPDNNPYHTAVHNLVSLLKIECNHSTILRFISFISHTNPNFKSLLQRKDARALLLLAYWYAKVCHCQWWIARRAMLECRATCMYLERYHSHETAIQQLLWFPKIRCGLSFQM